MKKILRILPVLVLFTPPGLFAGSIDYLTNQSAKWLISPSRNAATEGADIVNYNPAGTVFLPKGLHLDLSNQTLFKLYENGDTKFQSSPIGSGFGLTGLDNTFKPGMLTPALPNLYAVYNFGQLGTGSLALYLQGGITAGGGDLDWKDGTAGTTYALSGLSAGIFATTAQGGGTPIALGEITSQSFKASSIYYGIGLGGAYSFLEDFLSVGLGCRLVIPQRSFALTASFANGGSLNAEYEYNALGFTPIIGFDVRPAKGLTLAARYEMETSLEFEYDEKNLSADSSAPALTGVIKNAGAQLLKNNGIQDGVKFNLNLPHIIAVGAEYQVNDALAVSLSGNVYLLSVADYGENTGDYFGIGYEIGLGTTYKLIENLTLGLGLIYTESGAKDLYFTDSMLNASANPPLDSVAVGLGGTYAFKNGLDITLSGLYSHYLPRDFTVLMSNDAIGTLADISGTYKKDVIEVGIGIGFHY